MILLPLPLKIWDYRWVPLHQAWCSTLNGGLWNFILQLLKNYSWWVGSVTHWKNIYLGCRWPWFNPQHCPKKVFLVKFTNWIYLILHSYLQIVFFFFCFLLLCWVGVYCGIYKSSDNVSDISYLSSWIKDNFPVFFQFASMTT
jgi:hypothetical protein